VHGVGERAGGRLFSPAFSLRIQYVNRGRFYRSAAALLILVLLGFSAWSYLIARQVKDQADPAVARKRGEPIPVRAEVVAPQTVEDVIGATAITVPSQVAWLEVGPSQSTSTGAPSAVLIVKAVHMHEGEFVRKGQLICEFEQQPYVDLVKQKSAALDAANATLARVIEQLKYNQKIRELNLASAREGISYRAEDEKNKGKESEIYRKLSTAGAASLIQYLEARSKLFDAQFESSEAKRNLERAQDYVKVGLLIDKQELAKATSDVQAAQVDLELAKVALSRLEVHSPIDGFLTYENSIVNLESSVGTFESSLGAAAPTSLAPTIGARPPIEPVPGQSVASNAALGQVLKVDPIDLLVDFPLERIDELAIGDKGEVVLDSRPKETYSGQVVQISPKVNPQVRIMPLLLRIENSKAHIKPGITAFVRIRTRKQAMTVPATAVLRHNSRAVVFCVKDGRARLREIHTGHVIDNNLLEVNSGLAAGDQVVVFQNFYRHVDELTLTDCYLKDDDRVDVDWRRWTGRK
jgi:multidrug efflux pump subunit AcrA (membrane-fusion protein)